MPKTLALITVHGMGDTPRDYHRELHDRLKETVGTATWSKVAFRPLYYQHLLQGSQSEIFNRMRRHVGWTEVRKFLLHGFSDATSLEYAKQSPTSPYHQTQLELLRTLDALFDEAYEAPIPLIVVAQSLGCQVISSYCWDAQQQKASVGVWSAPREDGVADGSPRDRFRRLGTLARLYTTGCNIPIFVAGHRDIRAIAPPNERFRWHNFFDRDDVLGWPLRPLSPSYDRLVEDIPVNAGRGFLGRLLRSWNPFSHEQYWTDTQVTRHLASAIAQLA